MNLKQHTIAAEVSISGIGLHSGKNTTVTFKPAPDHFGIKFKRTDIENSPFIEADADLVVDTSRGTTLEKEGVRVSTVEHILSAIVALQIDNIIIETTNIEMPIMDGSALPFYDALENIGLVEQKALRKYYHIDKPISYKDEARGVELTITPSDSYRINAMVDYKSKVLGSQSASLNSVEEFKKEIASARTFCFLHEIEFLFKQGLVKGGSLDNAVVIVEDIPSKEKLEELSTLLNKDNIEVNATGTLNNTELRYENEPARHKLLDVLGDLALVGRPIKGHIFAVRPGHAANVELAKAIKKSMKNKKEAPFYDPAAKPLFTSTQVYQWLPHDAPFQLVDKITHLDDTSVIGVKNITINEPQFTGHFKNNPVFPGVLIIETIAQVGGIYVLNTVPDPDNYWTYLMGVEKCKFRRMVTPGDTLVIKCELLRPISRGIVNMSGDAYVNGVLVCETEILASIVKKDK